MSQSETGGQLAHIVFFTLSEPNRENCAALVASCRELLSGHEGMVFFGAGERGEEFDRPVNDAEFHVALHTVFESKAAHDAYQTSPRHLQFIEANKANWRTVRVFDSYV